AAPLEKHHRMAHIFGVLGRLHQIHAGRLTTLDLILQTRPRAVAEVTVLALPDEERLLQQAQALAYRAGTRIRAEVTPRLLLRATMDTQARKLTGGKKNVRIGFVVAQQDV